LTQTVLWLNVYYPDGNKKVKKMAEIIVGKNESIDNALKRFKRLVQKEGILSEIKKREHYEKPSEKRKKRVRAAIIRLQKNSIKKRKYE
jgi:small subunit ribosomal protein S21